MIGIVGALLAFAGGCLVSAKFYAGLALGVAAHVGLRRGLQRLEEGLLR